MKTHRKNLTRRGKTVMGGLRKFMVPPEVLIFRELRRMEMTDRSANTLSLYHHAD